ncbi:flagellar FlbD family protein [Paramaledivibacter caminithermalis]|jgi:flagellar protein FlbD|uniref:Flagellar protein FlbD n=1 Tax=Paramaledivibacter caminithermalis (strain DSM 15212 / CIP 107654 / DViRD3) TaxID=1121301 RepID=A0A1M6N7B5_PARC5|nr:flagellar FlbD family protein [Paramaledivibacter caminithermalis]SHJ91635.1 flagellar protein FlbD [Paramaledivibacter caminithermalis DSM 15212]
MIYLSRLNGEILAINSDLIEFIEETPNTVISMTTGRKIVVLEGIDEVIDKILEYKRRIFVEDTPITKYRRNEV